MPLVQGESLRDLLARDGALPPSRTMRLLREIVDGLAHAHGRARPSRHQARQRDARRRHVKLMDFGVAKA